MRSASSAVPLAVPVAVPLAVPLGRLTHPQDWRHGRMAALASCLERDVSSL